MRRSGRTKRNAGVESSARHRWMVSYADFITLLFAFFTTLYAISNTDAQKMGRIVLAMQSAFPQNLLSEKVAGKAVSAADAGRFLLPGGSLLPSVLPPLEKTAPGSIAKAKPLVEVKDQLEQWVAEERSVARIRISMDRRGLILRLGELNFFDSGSSDIRPEAKILLDKLTSILSGSEAVLRIEGHTDNIPIRTSRYPSNWELSTARATSIVLYLIEIRGFDPQRLSSAGYGEFRPLAANDTEENRAQNRRVDILIMNQESGAQEPVRKAV